MNSPSKPVIAIDIQTTLAQPTGFGFYVMNLVKELAGLEPEFDYELIAPKNQTRDFSTPERLWWDQISFPRRAAAARADLIHQPAFSAPIFTRAKVVVTVHDIIARLFGADIPFWSRQFFAHWMPFSYRWADHIIVDSVHTKNDLMREIGIPESKITVTYLAASKEYQPIRDESYKLRIREKYKIPKGPYLVHVGTINPRKNLEFLVEVFAQVAKSEPSLSLVISGKKGWYYERLFALVDELNLKGRVIFTGYLPDQDKPALLAGATIFSFPSIYEGFGLPPLEAMSVGTPVIASSASSIPEVVGEAGILVDPRDKTGWVTAINRVLKNRSLQKKLTAAGLKQAQKFNWLEIAKQTVAVYRHVLHPRGNTPGV